MKAFSLFTGVMLLLLMGYTGIHQASVRLPDQIAYKKARLKVSLSSVRCMRNWNEYPVTGEEIRSMILLPGTGTHKWKISTSSDSAQLYFNQGINLYYGFHITESLPSFEKALRFDTSCAMLYWGVALSYGPNINDAGYVQSKEAVQAVKSAKFYMNQSSLKEKDLIEAMDAHYSADTALTRDMLNQDYADRMKTLYHKYPADPEIGVLYADALMNLHPWDYWKHDGQPRSWTPELMAVLENIIKNYPDHPGANHYYIHTMEASPFASKAVASADKLGDLAPGLSHMVHMPSHIYIRTGEYAKGVKVNEAAVKAYYRYKKLYPDVVNSAFLYEYHNLHMQAASSINMGEYAKAIQDALDCRNALDTSLLSTQDAMGNYAQYVYMTPEFTRITFEKWNDILNESEIGGSFHYGKLIQEFAWGMAYANTGKLEKAKSCLSIIDSIILEKDMAMILAPMNAPVTGATVAKYILMGTIAEKQGKMADAIGYFKKGVETEDSLIYQEPRDWLVPARHYLGNALLKEKRFKDAENVFGKDLVYQPGNYISISGINKAKQKQK